MGQKYSYLLVSGGIWGLLDVTMSEFSVLLMALLLTDANELRIRGAAGSVGVGSSALRRSGRVGPFLHALPRWERLIFQAVGPQLWRFEDAAEQPVNDS